MQRVIKGMAALSLLLMPQIAGADPGNADIWIGVDGTSDGFLLDTVTGELWMTGACLKSLSPAEAMGDTWVSHHRELVSVGRGQTLLDQTFRLTIADAQPEIVVFNPDRGGEQSIPNAVLRDCTDDDFCERLLETPSC